MLRDDDPPLADVLRQGGRVITREQLLGAGLDGRLLDRRSASRAWTRFGPSVAVAARQPSLEQACAAALAHAGSPAAVTGRAACLLHGLRDAPALGAVQVLLPHQRRVITADRVQVVRTRVTTPLRRVRGVPVVLPARAVRDAVRGLSLQDVRALVLAAVADGQLAPGELDAELGPGPLPGRAHLLRAVRDAVHGAASAPEAEFHDLLAPVARRRGLEVLLNPWLVVDRDVLCRPDAYLPALGLGFEVDSARHHGDGPGLTRTLQRHDRVDDHGVRLRHVTPHELRSAPRDVLAYVVRQLDAGGSPPTQVHVRRHDDPPPWVTVRGAA